MTLPAENLILSSRKAASQMATRDTPFVFNEWYVAAFAADVGRELLPRTLLGKRILMYRTREGTAIAMDDRCVHRSYPLSKSTLDGDTIVCNYHGFRYSERGELIEVPSQKACPRGIGIRTYPLVERGPLLWIWMGDTRLADDSRIPDQPWTADPTWECSSGYFHHPGNYVSMHENLLDLTHLQFLHANTIGTPDYASAPFDLDIEEGHYKLIRRVVPTTLPAVWAKTTKIEGPTAARIVTSEFISPALHRVSVTFYDTALPEHSRPIFHIHTAHVLTPETEHTMHYHIIHGRDFAQEDHALGEFMHEQLFAAFEEDVEGLGTLEEVIGDVDENHYEISVASDAPAVAMRVYLKRRAALEAAARSTPRVAGSSEQFRP
ncbi:Rieske 2Fe-2S domain-containing protein [Ectopseudomonas khazarica]|uniref:aromatic ring-hydroxylating dioxygenase subunit alpha n=1 Tax=Ectopseudomonas khazarica TaxID=2502979 RepID=UPI001AEF89A1|nr:aromatic ring-hydroxylating dioxygenase subunit alpha [Pseudomonas khazarica]QTS86985.1 Rieske 2Fe-2S domain-containing protein [Pseudomonas khazarica]